MLVLTVLAGLLGLGQALYSASDAVIDLTPSNFDKQVTNGEGVWIVEFYAPWCGHCKNLVPDYKKAAKALKGIVKVGAVNADEHRSLGGQFGVQGFPTIKVFGRDKKKPEDFRGNRNAQGIIDAGMAAAQKLVKEQLSGKTGSGGGGGSSSNAGAGTGEGKE